MNACYLWFTDTRTINIFEILGITNIWHVNTSESIFWSLIILTIITYSANFCFLLKYLSSINSCMSNEKQEKYVQGIKLVFRSSLFTFSILFLRVFYHCYHNPGLVITLFNCIEVTYEEIMLFSIIIFGSYAILSIFLKDTINGLEQYKLFNKVFQRNATYEVVWHKVNINSIIQSFFNSNTISESSQVTSYSSKKTAKSNTLRRSNKSVSGNFSNLEPEIAKVPLEEVRESWQTSLL
ncbi:hypothetical protein ACTFIR_002882 [Dictyostelium discoideum]